MTYNKVACVALRINSLASLCAIDVYSVLSSLNSKSTSPYGQNSVNKDFLHPDSRDAFVKRGVNHYSQRCLVLFRSLIPPELLKDLEAG